jgi:hypothetical protein
MGGNQIFFAGKPAIPIQGRLPEQFDIIYAVLCIWC